MNLGQVCREGVWIIVVPEISFQSLLTEKSPALVVIEEQVELWFADGGCRRQSPGHGQKHTDAVRHRDAS